MKKIKLHHVILFYIPLLFIIRLRNGLENDVWWHLKMGEYMWNSLTIPKTDLFSFTQYGTPWIMHEWFSEIILYGLYWTGGFYGMLAGNMILLGLTYYLLYKLTLLRTNSPLVSAALVAVTAGLTYQFWVYRPFILGYACFMAFLYLLELYSVNRTKMIWLLPVIMLVWVNAHGSYAMGFLLIILYFFSGVSWSRYEKIVFEHWTRRDFANLLLCLVLTVFAGLINPNGAKTLLYPFLTIGTSVITDNITEWLSPDFHSIYTKINLLVILGVFFLISLKKGSHRIVDLLLVFCFTGLYFISQRFLILYFLSMTSVAGFYISAIKNNPFKLREYHPLNILLTIFLVAAFAFSWPEKNEFGENPSDFPVHAVNYLKEKHLTGTIFNDFNWGGYLLWYRYPENKVFIDGRVDMYIDNTIEDYLTIIKAQPGALSLLEKYEPELILINKNKPLNELLKHSLTWKPVYRDETAVVYARTQK